MVNRYITALLVVLAATGMEAQTYQQALKFALTDISYDEFIQQPEAKALEEDILYVIKAIKQASTVLSMALLAKAVQTLPLGTAYAIWTGIGAVGTVLIGIFVFKEPATPIRLFFLFTLIASLIGLKVVSY